MHCRLLKLSLVVSLLFAAQHAAAVEPFKVRDIRVEGIQRTEAGTVFGYLPVRVGDTFNDEKGVQAIKSLFATGFFKDVKLEVEGDVLVVIVEERPAIASIEFSGTKEFDKEALKKALKEIGVAEARIFDKSAIERAEQELKRQYLSRGLYSAEVSTTITPLERNRVAVSFSVVEGVAAKIRQINIVGNKAYKESDLLDLLNLRTPGWLTWYTKADQYSKQKLAGDLESLKSYYLNRGYLEFQIESTQVSITPDKKDIFLTINIREGERYTVKDIRMEGETFGKKDELLKLVLLKSGDIFSSEKLTESTKQINDRLGNYGYAFANANAQPEVDREKKEVTFTIFVDPGRRAYVRKINIAGNTRTRDEVIRREFRQMESAWYDADKIKMSRDRVDRLGYFKQVNIETPEVPGTSDQVDVNIGVEEKPTGNILLGAGFSSSEKIVLSASVQQDNVFGSGKTVGVAVNTSRTSRTISVSQTDPYFTPDGVSRSYDLYSRRFQPYSTSVSGDYRITSNGGNIRFGVPFTELDTVFFGFGFENTNLETYANDGIHVNSPLRYVDYVNRFGKTSTAFPATVGWARDSRDSAIAPSRGRVQRANFVLALPFGDVKYGTISYQDQYFYPLSRKFTLAFNGDVSMGHGYSGQTLPVFKNYYAGGIGSVRGYQSASLGPRDTLTTGSQYIGGATRVIGNIEFLFPFPGSGNDRTLRMFTFLDAGNVFEEGRKIEFNKLKYSGGIGLSWISPVGPLKLSFAKPIRPDPTDLLQKFQFQLGAGF